MSQVVAKGHHNLFSESFGWGKFSSLSYHESNLWLIAQETMQLLVNYQSTLMAIQPKIISWTNLLWKISRYCYNFTKLSSLFDVKKQRTKTNPEKCYKFQGSIQAVFEIGTPILGTLIWACPNLILSKIETNIKCNSSFLIKSAT